MERRGNASARRSINPAFEGARLWEAYPAMWEAAKAAATRLNQRDGDVVEIEEETNHAAADVIFRTLFSVPIEHKIARDVFVEFRIYQRSQPILNIAAFLPLPKWMPRLFRRDTKVSARKIRALITQLMIEWMDAINTGTAQNNLATKILTTAYPETVRRLILRRWWIRSRSSFLQVMKPVLWRWRGPCI